MHCSIVNTASQTLPLQAGAFALSCDPQMKSPPPERGGLPWFNSSARSTERDETQAASVKATPLVFSISWSSPD